ncbi:hypothetical protein [Nonomuraea turkmeniaca]|uniref:hypothetical protein n=1 Tax=Nonomuraea turkmeniaca TaxID=103838 RepID=UPI0014769943|nr:hypothetical protein [Nonomuraea turkmeniaca]
MRDLAYLLDGLRCSACLAENTLWMDLAAGLVECRECGQGALLPLDAEEEL